jgi:uncharacterized membrane protein
MIIVPLIYVIIYVGLCWLLGFLGRNTKFAFWGNFWVAVIFTPVIGILVLLAQDRQYNPPRPMAKPPGGA